MSNDVYWTNFSERIFFVNERQKKETGSACLLFLVPRLLPMAAAGGEYVPAPPPSGSCAVSRPAPTAPRRAPPP